MRFQCRHCQCILDIDGCEPGERVTCGKCGGELVYPASPTSPGAMLGDFVIVRELGEGGMGKVYLAHQVSLDRNVALKVLGGKFAEDSSFTRHFINEARSAASLNHPNIIQAYAVSSENGLWYFAMEYVDGTTMKQVLEEEKTIPPARVLQIALDIVSALDYAWHASHMLHRDIKPDNIMLTRDGRTKLADLGLAIRQEEDGGQEEQELYGTPQYIAPELILKHPHDQRSDMYSLGATLYQALVGEYPYEADTVENLIMEHGRTPLKPIPEKIGEAAPGLVAVIEKLLSKRPAHRYQTFSELLADLQAVRDGRPPQGEVHPASQLPLDFEAPDPLALPANWRDRLEAAGLSSRKSPDGAGKAGKWLWLLPVLALAAAAAVVAGRLSGGASRKNAPVEAVAASSGAVQEKSPVEILAARISQEGFSPEVQREIRKISSSLSSGSPDYEAFMKACAPFQEKEMAAAREGKSRELKALWRKKIEQYRLQKEEQRKIEAARAEKQRREKEAAAEKKRIAAEKASRKAEIMKSKQKAVEDMVFHTRDFDFDSAAREFKMLELGLEPNDRKWAGEWLKCLQNAARAYALVHDSDRKYAGTKLVVGRMLWLVEEIQFDDLKLTAEKAGGKGERIEKVLDLGLLGNASLRTLVYAAMEKEGLGDRKEEFFGCLLWCRGGAEVFARKILDKIGGYKLMTGEEQMMRRAYVRGWQRLLKQDRYSAEQARIIYGDLKRRYAKETAPVDRQLQEIVRSKAD